MPASRSRMTGAFAVALGLILGGVLPLAGATDAAVAAVPSPPFAEVSVDPCLGSTDSDPADAVGVAPDLTLLFGQRLVDFNAGQVVVLYDAFGTNTIDGYPAVCGTRYVDGVGAVSEWMFCTDIYSHVCSGVNANGELLDFDGNPIPGLSERADGNPKLSNDQNKLVAYLVTHGHSYQGVGYYDFGATDAIAHGTSAERVSLQTLVWCISDPVDPATADPFEQERSQTCEANMDATEQQTLLSLIPDVPAVALSFGAPSAEFSTGASVTISLTTNLFNQPIALSVGGVAGMLSTVSAGATLAGNTLTVAGTDPTVPVVVELSFTASTAGTATFAASAIPVALSTIAWNQSPGITASDNKPCQIFATFDTQASRTVTSSTQALFVAAGSAGNGGQGEELTATGPAGSESLFATATAALLLGLALIAVGSRTRRAARRTR